MPPTRWSFVTEKLHSYNSACGETLQSKHALQRPYRRKTLKDLVDACIYVSSFFLKNKYKCTADQELTGLLHIRAAAVSFSLTRWLHSTAVMAPSSNFDVKSKIWLCQLMHIIVKNIRTKFHPYPLWNDRAVGFFVTWRHCRHLETVISNPKSHSVSQCIFTWGTILPNFVPI